MKCICFVLTNWKLFWKLNRRKRLQAGGWAISVSSESAVWPKHLRALGKWLAKKKGISTCGPHYRWGFHSRKPLQMLKSTSIQTPGFTATESTRNCAPAESRRVSEVWKGWMPILDQKWNVTKNERQTSAQRFLIRWKSEEFWGEPKENSKG